ILAITVVMAFRRKDVAYGAVIIWALAGIAVNQGSNPTMVAAAVIVAVVIVAAFAISMPLVGRRMTGRT
ncbi:MAG TPA: hypothetical protein PKX44_06810, partial [Methanomassiliicoccaceae archaeon]|nr:hypothetical protein [Methanomassiliicoccaceae archaeon]